jgi:hypothetical protein
MEGVCSAQVQAQNKHSGGDKDAMKKNVFCLALGAMLFALCFSAQAQQPRKMPLIGHLDYRAAIDRDEAFFQGLRDLGWIVHETLPQVKRVAFLWNPASPTLYALFPGRHRLSHRRLGLRFNPWNSITC